MGYFLASLLASSLVEKYNLRWHRKVLLITIPLSIIFILIFPEYLIYRLKKTKAVYSNHNK